MLSGCFSLWSPKFCYCYVVFLSQHAKAATAEGLTFSDPIHKKSTIFVIHQKNWQRYHPILDTMISIVYGSLVAGLPYNQDAFVGGHGRHFAQYLQIGSTNYPPSPLSFSRVNLWFTRSWLWE
jgi:hypothetical protein